MLLYIVSGYTVYKVIFTLKKRLLLISFCVSWGGKYVFIPCVKISL